MYVDKLRAEKAFNKYVDTYDISNEMIKLKIDHTYRVAELCEEIALKIGFNKEEADVAWLLGLLHDIGRFEQIKRFGTFNDAKSIDHAALGVEILFKDHIIRKFIDDDSEDKLIRDAVGCHNAYKVPNEFSKRTLAFSNILRDADKIDIFKVNILIPPEQVYGVSSHDVYTSSITKEVIEDFMKRKTVLRALKKTAVDHVIGHISLVFGLAYKESIEITVKMGCLEKLLQFKSQNNITNKQFEKIREFVHIYIYEQINTK